MHEDSFAAAQQKLVEDFVAQSRPDETAADVGFALLDLIFERERLRLRMQADDPRLPSLVLKTFAKLRTSDVLGPQFSVAEATFRRLADDPHKAMEYLQQYVAQRSAAQSARASKPRGKRHDSVTEAIRLMVEENPRISAKAVLRELAAMDGFLFIDDEIRVEGERPVKIANIPSRVSDAKKSLRKNSG